MKKLFRLFMMLLSNRRNEKSGAKLGIMPDYKFSGNGIRINKISEGKTAEKFGLQAGDIILKIDNYEIDDIFGYMRIMRNFKFGNSAVCTIKRSNNRIKKDVIFS